MTITWKHPDTYRYPKAWKIGDRVRYVRSINWGPQNGQEGVIIGFSEDHKDGMPANEYQVFYVRVGRGQFYTTPDDVEIILEDITKEGTRVLHKKRKSTYIVQGLAMGQISEKYRSPGCNGRIIKEGDQIVVYKDAHGQLWWRVPEEFEDGRFELVHELT